MDTRPGHLKTPPYGLSTEVGEIMELPALEETLPDVGDVSFDLRLVLGVTYPRRVGDEAPVLAVLQEAAGNVGIKGIGPGHGRWEIVEDHIAGNTAEEGPGRLQPFNNVPQLLPDQGPDEAVAGVAEDDHQCPDHPPPAALGIDYQPEAAEIHLGHLARLGVRHAHRAAATGQPSLMAHVAVQGHVGDDAVLLAKEFVNSSELEPVLL